MQFLFLREPAPHFPKQLNNNNNNNNNNNMFLI